MIQFQRFQLANGLKVLVHEDHTVPMAVLNILYDVGAKDESQSQTGFAQLFEHPAHGLAEHEIIANLLVTIFGGLETTAAMLANTLWLLLTHPDQFARVRRDPATLMRPAIEESLRCESPVQTATRHVAAPFMCVCVLPPRESPAFSPC